MQEKHYTKTRPDLSTPPGSSPPRRRIAIPNALECSPACLGIRAGARHPRTHHLTRRSFDTSLLRAAHVAQRGHHGLGPYSRTSPLADASVDLLQGRSRRGRRAVAIGLRQAGSRGGRSAHLQRAVDIIGHVAYLDHLRHVYNRNTCGAHACTPAPRPPAAPTTSAMLCASSLRVCPKATLVSRSIPYAALP